MYRHLLLEYSNQLLIAIVTGIWLLQAVRDVLAPATRVLKSTVDSYSNRYLGITGC